MLIELIKPGDKALFSPKLIGKKRYGKIFQCHAEAIDLKRSKE